MDRLTERNFNITADYVMRQLNAFPIVQCLSRLQEYENAEEEGLLVRLPCKIGDTVYEVNERGTISTYKITNIRFSDYLTLIGWTPIDGVCSNLNGFAVSALGRKIFLTRADAEKALAEMGNEL